MLVSSPVPCRSRSRVVAATYGFDPDLCGLGSDPSSSLNGAGLRVPTLATTSAATRYLFQCATVRLTAKPMWLVGLAQLLTLYVNTAAGTGVPVAPVEMLVGRAGSGDPLYHFTDATVSWHLRLVRAVPRPRPNTLTSESFAWRWAGSSPALVFETATFDAANLDGKGAPDNYVALTGYTPPWNGQPSGVDVAGLGTWNSIDYPWDNPAEQSIEPIEVRGPGALVLYASVWQTSPDTRAAVEPPAAYPMPVSCPEQAFVLGFPQAVYGRVGGKLIVERRGGA
jgi:hypothetical protein